MGLGDGRRSAFVVFDLLLVNSQEGVRVVLADGVGEIGNLLDGPLPVLGARSH